MLFLLASLVLSAVLASWGVGALASALAAASFTVGLGWLLVGLVLVWLAGLVLAWLVASWGRW